MPLLISLLLLTMPLNVMAAELLCPNSWITIHYEKKSAFEHVCETIESANVFLESFGMRISGDLHITLYGKLPKNGMEYSIGYYDSQRNEIHLLDYQATLRASNRAPPAFGVAMNHVIWRSYLVHEYAHAAAQKKFTTGVSICIASEYIASVTQIATLPSDERTKIMINYPELKGFDGVEEITMALYMLDPSKFSINAYLHYSKPANGVQFIRRLLCEGLPND